jgi:hypothetical protein
MSALLVVLALIVVAALLLAVELLRPEPVSERRIADLSQALTPGRDYEPMVRLFEERAYCPVEQLPSGAARLSKDRGRVMRMYLKRFRGDFLTAWGACRQLAPISKEPNPTRKLFLYWLRFHWLFARVWVATYAGQRVQAVGKVNRLVAAFGDIQQWASALTQIDAGSGVGASPTRRIRI